MIDIEKLVLHREVAENPLIRIYLIAMKYFGYILFDNQKRKRLHWFRGIVISFSFILFNITQFVDLCKHFDNLDAFTKNASTTLLFATTSFRMINFCWNRTRYVNIVRTVDLEIRGMLSLDDIKAKRTVSSSISYQKQLTLSFWISALITGNLMCVNSAVQGILYETGLTSYQPTPILLSWFPFDYRDHFWVVYAVQYYTMNVGMLIVPCWHAFIVSIMVYVITKLKILSQTLSKLDENSDVELVKCVNEREKLYEFVKELSSLISSSIFLDFIVFSILLCALLFQATQVDDFIQLAIIFFYLLTMTAILWMYYHHANEISFHSDQLSESAYKCSWFNFSLRYQKHILLFMTSTKPIKMYAGFIDMKLETFLAILRASYSYFPLLMNLASN